MLQLLNQNGILTSAGAILTVSTALLYAVIQSIVKSTKRAPRGCRRLGLPKGQSNLYDEFDSKYSSGVPESSADEQGLPAWRVKALFTYPIKSCTGVELVESDVVSTGFAFDRQFCFGELDETRNWIARTLRNKGFNRLALVRPEIWVPDLDMQGYSYDLEEVRSGGVMVVYYPRPSSSPRHGAAWNAIYSTIIKTGMYFGLIPNETSFIVPLFPSTDSKGPNTNQKSGLPLTNVKIWKDNPLAYNYGQYIPSSFHDFLSEEFPESNNSTRNKHSSASIKNRQVTLFRVNPSHPREIYRNAPRKEELGFQPTTGFADAYPIHILSLSSVRDVNARCAKDIQHLSIRRFRANVIVQGPAAFEEDDWKVIRISPSTVKAKASGEEDNDGQEKELVIHTACRTIRCKLPNVNPDTGIRHPSEPDRTLKSYRKIDQGDLTNACLGMQGVPAVRESRIRVGDKISVVETGEHRYIKMLAPGEVVEGV
ncbi:MOSC domain protein [Aspergillus mulundensis]|uniref:MOSC domain-containing protein n=1 Tax=Aspergillus mulundensis TaxID=1810919 RepID=A0A3D8SBG2_9EURO|nr:Uncharacterized protein DSM5745_04025 [Aspergillus mulundensis]RDW83699.1 Uncharacterized protein DSM5745_04025 [Aspergillus mulundensis]